jgi:hypothetical protein
MSFEGKNMKRGKEKVERQQTKRNLMFKKMQKVK